MTILERISALRAERNWSEYRLSVETGIPQSTISSWFRKDINPTVASLEKICEAFHITMAQFFMFPDEPVALTREQEEVLHYWSRLTTQQQKLLLDFLKTI